MGEIIFSSKTASGHWSMMRSWSGVDFWSRVGVVSPANHHRTFCTQGMLFVHVETTQLLIQTLMFALYFICRFPMMSLCC